VGLFDRHAEACAQYPGFSLPVAIARYYQLFIGYESIKLNKRGDDLRKLIMSFYASIILVAIMALGYHPIPISQTYESTRSVSWSDSITNAQGADSPKIFAVIGDVQKFLTDRKIGVNIIGDRYELLYKRIY